MRIGSSVTRTCLLRPPMTVVVPTARHLPELVQHVVRHEPELRVVP